MNKFLLLVLSVCISFLSLAATPINFQHKSISKALQKNGIENMGLLKEIDLPQEINNGHLINGKYYQVSHNSESTVEYVYIGRVTSCRADGCSKDMASQTGGENEYFDYFILFDAEKKVAQVKVYNYQATHGQEITVKGWLKQFIGYSATEELEVNKNIDSISGATISVYAITDDVANKTQILEAL